MMASGGPEGSPMTHLKEAVKGGADTVRGLSGREEGGGGGETMTQRGATAVTPARADADAGDVHDPLTSAADAMGLGDTVESVADKFKSVLGSIPHAAGPDVTPRPGGTFAPGAEAPAPAAGGVSRKLSVTQRAAEVVGGVGRKLSQSVADVTRRVADQSRETLAGVAKAVEPPSMVGDNVIPDQLQDDWSAGTGI